MARNSHNGVYYDDNLDHEAEIAKAVEKGDYDTAAFYEKRRNAKIDGEGLDYEKTYRYIDENGNALYGKNDLNSLGDPSKNSSGWNSSQSSRINSLMNGIMNMPKFSYDAQKDPIYQQYKAQAEESAKRVTEDTMASYAGMTGGVPSSYAVMAGQQSGERYRRSADEMIPELYQLAYGMYADERADKYNQLNTLLALDQNEYNRYRDTVLDGRYEDEFAYKVEQDSINNELNSKYYDLDERKQDEVEEQNDETRKYNEKVLARENVWNFVLNGIPPTDEEMIAAGYEGISGQDLIDGIRNNQKWALDLQAQYTKSSSGGYGSSPIEGELRGYDSKIYNGLVEIYKDYEDGKYGEKNINTIIEGYLNSFAGEYDVDKLKASASLYFGYEEPARSEKKTDYYIGEMEKTTSEDDKKALVAGWFETGEINGTMVKNLLEKFGIDTSEYQNGYGWDE